MARIDKIPLPKILAAFRGLLDFYCYRNLPCVRSWPRRPKMPRSPASTAASATWTDYAKTVPLTDPSIKDEATEAAAGTSWTWKDLLTNAAYNHLISWS